MKGAQKEAGGDTGFLELQWRKWRARGGTLSHCTGTARRGPELGAEGSPRSLEAPGVGRKGQELSPGRPGSKAGAR